MNSKILLAVFLGLSLQPRVFAYPSEEISNLLNHDVSLLDFGMYKMELELDGRDKHFSQYFWDTYAFAGRVGFFNVRYSWNENKIVIQIGFYNDNKDLRRQIVRDFLFYIDNPQIGFLSLDRLEQDYEKFVGMDKDYWVTRINDNFFPHGYSYRELDGMNYDKLVDRFYVQVYFYEDNDFMLFAERKLVGGRVMYSE